MKQLMSLYYGIKIKRLTKVKLHLGYAGYCLAKETHTIKGGNNINVKFNALWALIYHPVNGYILFDTGYTKRFFEATKKYPNKLYANLTKVVLKKSEEVKEQLKKNNLDCNEIKHIVISHFHADHVGGLKDFKNAKIHVSKAALNQVNKIPKFLAFSKGILKDLIPKNLNSRVSIIEENSTKIKDAIFNYKYDLFGDNALLLLNLSGHAAGQIGLMLETENGKYFLIADACWNIKAITENKLPSPVVRLFFDSWQDYKKSILKVKEFYNSNNSVKIIPTHCAATTDKLVSDLFFSNEL